MIETQHGGKGEGEFLINTSKSSSCVGCAFNFRLSSMAFWKAADLAGAMVSLGEGFELGAGSVFGVGCWEVYWLFG